MAEAYRSDLVENDYHGYRIVHFTYADRAEIRAFKSKQPLISITIDDTVLIPPQVAVDLIKQQIDKA